MSFSPKFRMGEPPLVEVPANDPIYQNEEILKKEAEEGREMVRMILGTQPRFERSKHKLTFI